jgi:hypothetical protein
VAIRLALGLCEGGLLPGMVSLKQSQQDHPTYTLSKVLYLSTMYKRHELQLRYYSLANFENVDFIDDVSLVVWVFSTHLVSTVTLYNGKGSSCLLASLSGAFGGES